MNCAREDKPFRTIILDTYNKISECLHSLEAKQQCQYISITNLDYALWGEYPRDDKPNNNKDFNGLLPEGLCDLLSTILQDILIRVENSSLMVTETQSTIDKIIYKLIEPKQIKSNTTCIDNIPGKMGR